MCISFPGRMHLVVYFTACCVSCVCAYYGANKSSPRLGCEHSAAAATTAAIICKDDFLVNLFRGAEIFSRPPAPSDKIARGQYYFAIYAARGAGERHKRATRADSWSSLLPELRFESEKCECVGAAHQDSARWLLGQIAACDPFF